MRDLWVPVSAAVSQQRNVDIIANNVANANTPGFKRDQLIFREYLTALEKGPEGADLPSKEWKPDDFYRSYGAENSFVKIDGSYTRHEQGQLTPTANPLDLGINGPGFFEVLTPQGIRYTRKGIFTISNTGEIVTDQGYRLLAKVDLTQLKQVSTDGDNGTKIPDPSERTIKVTPGKISINQEGDIFINETQTGSISIVEFKDNNALRREGNSLFINSDIENLKNEIEKTSIHQGFIEESNVNAISEMAELIKASRHFENIQQAIKAYDSMAGKSVNELSRF